VRPGRVCTSCGAINHYPIAIDGSCRLCVGGLLGADYAELRRWMEWINVWSAIGQFAASRVR